MIGVAVLAGSALAASSALADGFAGAQPTKEHYGVIFHIDRGVYVKGNGFEKRLRALQKEGVLLSQCSNTLHEQHVDPKNLYSFIHIVPSGMGEITIREAQGWAYIHPSSPESQL